MPLSNSCSTLCAMVTASWAASLLWGRKDDGTRWQPRLSTARVSSRRKSEHSRVKSESLPGHQSFWFTLLLLFQDSKISRSLQINICVHLTKVKGIRQRPILEESHSCRGFGPSSTPTGRRGRDRVHSQGTSENESERCSGLATQ